MRMPCCDRLVRAHPLSFVDGCLRSANCRLELNYGMLQEAGTGEYPNLIPVRGRWKIGPIADR